MCRLRDLFCAISVVASITVLAGCARKTEDSIREVQSRGNEIIVALSKYRSDHSSYPVHLTDLVPKYLQLIRRPPIGAREWSYALRKDGRGFILATVDSSPDDLTCWYNSYEGVWAVDTK